MALRMRSCLDCFGLLVHDMSCWPRRQAVDAEAGALAILVLIDRLAVLHRQVLLEWAMASMMVPRRNCRPVRKQLFLMLDMYDVGKA